MRQAPQTDDGEQHPGRASRCRRPATRLGDLVGREARQVREGDEEQPGDDQARHATKTPPSRPSPSVITKNEARSGPRAKPMLPPTEKSDMPLARRRLPLT